MWDSLGVLALRAASGIARAGERLRALAGRAPRATGLAVEPATAEVTRLRVPMVDERPPLPGSVLRLVACVAAGAVAASAVILAVGVVAVRTVLGLVG
jgi:hypothetical protein